MRLIIIFSILTLLFSGCVSTATKSDAETKRPTSAKEFHLRERI